MLFVRGRRCFMLKIELVYVTEDGTTTHLHLDIKEGKTVVDAIEASGLYGKYPEIKTFAVGIYSKKVTGDAVLKEGDRVEIYRPLALDPKEKRRRQARLNKGR